MPATTNMRHAWKFNPAYISMLISLFEVLTVVCAAVFMRLVAHYEATALRIVSVAWLVGGASSIGFALFGIVKGPRRILTSAALGIATATGMLVGLSMLV